MVYTAVRASNCANIRWLSQKGKDSCHSHSYSCSHKISATSREQFVCFHNVSWKEFEVNIFHQYSKLQGIVKWWMHACSSRGRSAHQTGPEFSHQGAWPRAWIRQVRHISCFVVYVAIVVLRIQPCILLCIPTYFHCIVIPMVPVSLYLWFVRPPFDMLIVLVLQAEMNPRCGLEDIFQTK